MPDQRRRRRLEVNRDGCLRGQPLHRLASQAAGFDVAILPPIDRRNRHADRVRELFLRHAETLAPLQARAQGPIRLLAAARIGKIRLIDNVAV